MALFSNRAFAEVPFGGLGISPDVTIVPAGLSATGSVNSVAVALENNHPVFGNTGTTALGSVTVDAKANVSVTGQQVTASLGDETILEGTGVDVAVTLGAATTSLGEEAVIAAANTSVTGVGATTGLGTVSQVTIYRVTGVEGTSGLGQVTVWGLVNTGQDPEPVYNDVDENISNAWTDVGTPSSNWNEVRL